MLLISVEGSRLKCTLLIPPCPTYRECYIGVKCFRKTVFWGNIEGQCCCEGNSRKIEFIFKTNQPNFQIISEFPDSVSDHQTFLSSLKLEMQVTRSLASAALDAMQMMSAYQNDPIIKHYEIDINDAGKFLYFSIYQIDSEEEKSLITDTSYTDSCQNLSTVLKSIQKNIEVVNKTQPEAQKRLHDAEDLIESFLLHIKSDESLNAFPELKLNSTPYKNLQNVIETIRNHFLLESPALIAQFAEAFANIYVSIHKTVEIYDTFMTENIEKSQNLKKIHEKNC